MYRAGSIIKFRYEHDGVVEDDHLFMLVNCFEENFLFQIVCIKGYHTASVEGYIRHENVDSQTITKDHLVNELNRSFINIHWNTFKDGIKIVELGSVSR